MKALKIANAATAVLLVILLLSAVVAVTVSKLSGVNLFAITNGSMEKTIYIGDLVVSKPCDFEEIAINDIMVFADQNDRSAFTHKVVDIDVKNRLLYTKGEANEVNDPVATPYAYVKGKVIKTIPFLGFFAMVLQSSWGLIAVAVMLVLFIFIDIIFTRKEGRRNEKA